MGDFYKIVEALDGDSDALAIAMQLDNRMQILENQMVMGVNNTSEIDRRAYIERTDAILKNTEAIKNLTLGLLNIEGVLKRSGALS